MNALWDEDKFDDEGEEWQPDLTRDYALMVLLKMNYGRQYRLIICFEKDDYEDEWDCLYNCNVHWLNYLPVRFIKSEVPSGFEPLWKLLQSSA